MGCPQVRLILHSNPSFLLLTYIMTIIRCQVINRCRKRQRSLHAKVHRAPGETCALAYKKPPECLMSPFSSSRRANTMWVWFDAYFSSSRWANTMWVWFDAYFSSSRWANTMWVWFDATVKMDKKGGHSLLCSNRMGIYIFYVC